ncbi:SIMPL domain-containing protein [Pararhizobium sp. YC-54]|uniref:SIMPL domain-containing protein n=1 Tax=Pararhizobium sp. YC-54 TaxID=2986920 RepID=UPI0021F6D165|nr:SIMPL domain-containing protein [Pararhizobium sp. YC-54]MCV9999939.1 SIMPL domain-containing protein [Pararhizobium sp. YC-54]
MTPTYFPRRLKTVVLAAAFAGAASASAFAEDTAPREAVITVSGEGQASVAPDMAILSFSVVKDAKTAREALDANNKAMADVLNALKTGGIADRDLQTSGFAVNPQYQYPDNSDGGNRQPVLTGYQVANSLTIKVRDLAKLGEIIDQSVTLGVNQGGSIQFSNDKPEAVITGARKSAVTDAVAKAKVLSEAAGVSLGRIVEISENASRPEPMPMMRTMAKEYAADAVPIATGENSYNVTVNVTFAIKQ